ncbi:hypothetical protein HPT27_06455 [Permianibacter sp. IMCC34836]|uniref:PspA/IM30 family protein n=1 Tax=Permianibacter fluminis TaxID=2738515 RepID=UPI0015574F17|nr:hypothetical protein [Permianibacter fluminis]NQD36660.1 hypothetical protein [Permianibacter fluminis]
MALEWFKQEMRALWPQGQRWLQAMRHELVRVQALHRRERARERVLQSELANARAALASWQARRDVAAGLPRTELAEAAAVEVQRRAAEVEAIQVVLAKQSELVQTLTEKLTAMEARFVTASEQHHMPRRPALLIASTLAELAQREQRFAESEQQLQRQRLQWDAPLAGAASDMTTPVPFTRTEPDVGPATELSSTELTPQATTVAATAAKTDAATDSATSAAENAEPIADADFVTAASSTDKQERAP